MVLGGEVVGLLAEQQMERSLGIIAKQLHQGKAGKPMKAARERLERGEPVRYFEQHEMPVRGTTNLHRR